MALAGRAFLALWNDIALGREPEYDQWHTLEHVPERVAVTGSRGARRYVNRERDVHRYFTLYDVDSLAVFDSPEYRDLVDHPTAWSAAMRPDFSHLLRATCTVELSRGTGIGAAVACLCVGSTVTSSALHGAVNEALALPRVNAAHVGRRHDAATPSAFATSAAAGVREFDRVALLEALDRGAALAALLHAKHVLQLDGLPGDFGDDVYDLAFVFPGNDAAERRAHRRPGWDAQR